MMPSEPEQNWWREAQIRMWVLVVLLFPTTVFSDWSHPCFSCKKGLSDTYYYSTDKVTGEKVFICATCNKEPHHCFACGLPALSNGLVLQDGRHYCKRDGDLAVVDAATMSQLVQETLTLLDRNLNHYLTFPTANVNVDMMDRLNVEAMRTAPGHDFACPNLLGLHQATTNAAGQRVHSIDIMTGLTKGITRATLAHELTHAWINENIPDDRQLGRFAEEGFCELVAYQVAQSLNDAATMKSIEMNLYTRGQFALFKEAKRRYELQTILDWLRYGTTPEIDPADIDQVRRVRKPAKAVPKLWMRYSPPSTNSANSAATPEAPASKELVLKGIIGSANRRMAMVSGKSLLVGETANVELGDVRVEIKCLEIGPDFVRIERHDTGEIETLTLDLD